MNYLQGLESLLAAHGAPYTHPQEATQPSCGGSLATHSSADGCPPSERESRARMENDDIKCIGVWPAHTEREKEHYYSSHLSFFLYIRII